VQTLDDAGIRIAVKPWVKVPDYVAAGTAINRAIVEKLRNGGIDYPQLTRDIRLVGAEPSGRSSL
jgi:small conductance mechanosensitive channel